ncbi:hypothetical protein Fmac_000275 [Flemingia macrophylla]|uniref:Transmembrane and coiled-coil domain-containing protein 4-like n=1 Tax=Flemingia macrophylla TaxID=520843 RepID=A0ABD1NDU5_9FABA
MEESSSFLSRNHRNTAASLFALSFHHSQIHLYPNSKSPPLSENYDFLCPIFRLKYNIKRMAASFQLLKLLSEESDAIPSERFAERIHGQKTKTQDAPSEIMESSALLPLEKSPSTELVIATFEQPLEEANLISYQRKVTTLYTLVAACVADFPAEKDKKGIHLREGYDARHRAALRLVAAWLGVKWNEMEAMEAMVAYTLMNSMSKEGEAETVGSENNWDKWKRGSLIGAAAVTGGTVMAITGGLAAPAIAHGLGALAPALGGIAPAIGGGFAAAATATGSVVGSAAVAASFGAAGAGLTGSKMATRIGNLEEFQLKEIGGANQGQNLLFDFQHLTVSICISGLAFDDKDFVKPWEGLNDNTERYALQYESQHLIALSTAIHDWLKSSSFQIVTELMKEGAMMTVLGSLVTALAWPATLVTTFDIIDSKWAVAIDRSDKAGKVLSEVPVTLVGFSLGARVIYKCLQHLAENEGAGIVERVVFLGAPIPIKDENWEAARKMVAGRFVNVYSTNDWTLGVTFRASLLSQGLAGIQPVDIPGVENVNVTKLIEGHNSYLCKTQNILEQLELDNTCAVITGEHENPKEEKSTQKGN